VKVLLISANTETINMPAIPMGLGCVAAALESAGHRVRLVDLLVEKDPSAAVEAAIAAETPGVIGISVRNIDDQNMQHPRFLLEGVRPVVGLCKERCAAPVVLGGPGYSIFPQACLDHLGADMGIRGEGEGAFVALVNALEKGDDPAKLAGVFLRGRSRSIPVERIPDLDRFSPPSPKWFPSPAYRSPDFWLPVQTRRGCPLTCSYCSTPAIEGGTIRRRAEGAAVAFLKDWAAAGFRKVFFVDNTFNLPESFARSLCRRITTEGVDISWRCILYPGKVSRELVRDMASAGCCEVSLGFESGDPQILAAMNKRFGPEQIQAAAQLLAEAGIRQMGFLLLGGPGETRESVKRSIAFVERLYLDMVKMTVGIRIYPETRVAEIAREKGLIDPEDNLLYPRFYLEPELDGWIFDFVRQTVETRPGWVL
jgi:radical SAM superfamily enzyme YgiQ (UPF0313 family)